MQGPVLGNEEENIKKLCLTLILQTLCSWKKKRERERRYKSEPGDFPSGPVIKTLPSNAGGVGLIPG